MLILATDVIESLEQLHRRKLDLIHHSFDPTYCHQLRTSPVESA